MASCVIIDAINNSVTRRVPQFIEPGDCGGIFIDIGFRRS